MTEFEFDNILNNDKRIVEKKLFDFIPKTEEGQYSVYLTSIIMIV